ncbi:protoporphyrinogen/coproporphyrinogen oxidase [Georgenia faecalis]|uniref:Protoporphyrinogen/coproporphyrinogen oxidase n=1 Tax=Georgenia faecalis TaxID=2483799 RepID=A0ABV9D734_9MICO|nr:FAD-dependent oxidoreductase [Georgenia faecalis]
MIDVVVVGGGMAGLTVAAELAARGRRPLVLEASGAVGGLVAAGVVGGLEVDLGAEAFAVRRGEVADLAASVGLAVERPAGGSWVWAPDGPVRIPAESLLGIPADPGAPDVVAALGPDGAARAARDASLGPEVGADATDLATLVRTRMGEAVLARLVGPVAGGVHNADPADLAVDSVAPGLRGALAAEGSLAAAVRVLRAASGPGAAVATTTGGLFRLPRALAAAVERHGGAVRTASPVTVLRRHGEGWEVEGSGPAGPFRVQARAVVLALPERAALPLLAGVVDVGNHVPAPGSAITHVTLVVRAPALDAAPRGAGLLVPPGPVRAKALTHATAKWAWLGAAAGPGVHVLRVSYGRRGEPTDDVDADLARRDAAALLGVALAPDDVLDAHVVRRSDVLAAATPAHREAVTALAERAGRAGVHLAGTAVAGTGVAAVVGHARGLATTLAAPL